MNKVLGTLAALGSLVLVAAIIWGGYVFGWWLKKDVTDRQVKIDNRNLGTQQAWQDEVSKTIADFEIIDPSNSAARGALRNKACRLIVKLSDTYRTSDIDLFYELECAA